MKIKFGAVDISSTSRGGSAIDWVKGLRERNIARMELYNQSRTAPLALVVTLVDGSLYLIRRVANKNASISIKPNTIENTTSSHFTSRPVITVTFHPQSYPDLHLILHVSYSVPEFDNNSKVDGRSFGLTVLLNTVRHVLTNPSSTGPSTQKESPEDSNRTRLSPLWKDAYELVQKDDHDFWEGSLPERTNNLIRELIHRAAYDALQKTPDFTEPLQGFTLTAYIYSTIAQVEMLALRSNTQFSPPNVAWDESWVNSTPAKLRMLSLPFLQLTGNNTRRLSAQIDARDLPHQYRLSEILQNTNLQLVGDGFIGHEGDEIILGPSCIQIENTSGREAETQSPETGSTPSQPINNRSYNRHIRISDWQVAAHLAWGYAWPEAFKAGQNRAEPVLQEVGHSNDPRTPKWATLVSQPRHPAVSALIRLYQHQLVTYKKKVGDTPTQRSGQATRINEQNHPALSGAAQKEAKPCQDTDTKNQYKEAYDTASCKRRGYKKKASERAMKAMLLQGGEEGLEYVAQQEWQKLRTGSFVGRFCSDQGWLARWWRKVFRDTCEEAWSNSWDATWLAVWEEAYQLANSKGIEFGVESAMRQGSSRKTLLEKESYKTIQQYIKQDRVSDILNNIRLLTQDLNHISGLIAIHNVYTYDNRVTICALVPNKNQDLEDISRILHKQPVSRELSYMELKHFIIEQYFKKEPRQRRTSFKNCVSKSWKDLPELLGKTSRS